MHQNPARDALRTIDAPLDPDSPSTFDATGAYHPSPDTLPIVSGPAGVLPSIPGYALTGEIARGGMGRVLAGRELSLDREVAIKVLLPGADAGRFVTESKITAKLPHPNIPPVYALGALDDGSPFLAMKYVRGRTLADELTVRPDLKAELPRFLQIFEQIAQAVGFAHARGIIHRDLKPANVMVGEFGEVQVMDWGLARASGSAEHGVRSEDAEIRDPEMTQAGAIMGTPAYMAPEQARGEPADARADVFALGGILTAILTGKAVFAGGTAVETIQLAAGGDTADALARLSACGVGTELVAVATACLHADRADRPVDGRAVANLVADYRLGVEQRLRQAEAERAAGVVREAEQRKRRRAIQLAAGVIAAVLLAGIVGTTIGLTRANEAKDAEKQRADGEEQAKLAEREAKEAETAAKEAALKDKRIAENTRLFFMKVLSRTSAFNIDGGSTNPNVTIKEVIDFALTLLAKDFKDDPEGEADIRACLGSIYMSQGENAKAKVQFDAARTIYKKLHGEESAKYLFSLMGEAMSPQNAGQSPELESVLALMQKEAAKPGDHRELLEIQTALLEGILAMRLGQFEIAERVLRKAHARADAKYGGDHLVTLSLRLGIVSSLASMKRHDEAERTLLDVQALATKKFGDTSLIGMSCDIYLGGLDGAKPNADPERSNNRYLAAIEAAKKLHLEHLQVLLPAHLSLALYYAENNKHPLALEHALRAEVLVTGPPVGSEESKRLVLFAKAVALLQLGRYAEAEPLCTKLMASVDKNKEPANYRYIEFAYCKALTLSGKFAEAEPICVRLLENCEQPPRAAPKQTALAHVFHLHIAIGLSRMNTVRAELTQIATACEKLPEAGRNDILAELRAAGRRASDQKKPEFAVAIHADAHRHYKRYFTMNHNETAVSAGDLAHALGVVGRQDGREQLYREAMDGTKAALGADHEYTRLCANNLVALYRTAGKNAEATAVLTTLYEWVATNNGPSNEVASQRAWQAIDLCKQLGRHADAVPVARKLVDALSAVTGADDWKRADARMALGECLLASGQTREAAVVLAQSLATGRLTHAGTTALAVNQTWLAEALIGEKKYAEAELLLLEAYPKLRADPTTRMATPADRAAERLVQLYTLTNKPDESKKWRAERAKYPVPTTLDDGSAATLPGLVATAKANPSDTILSIKLAALQTWHGHTADLGETQAWALKSAHATTDPATAERAAKTCCLRASEDKERLKVALALARRAAELGKDQPLHHYFWMALGMAEFRNGNFLAADKALTTAGFTDPVNEHVYLPSAFYRAMSLHRLGEEDEAKSIAKAAAAKMKPYPKDTGKPFADGYNADDLIVFLAYQEAAAMLQLDPKTRETLPPPRPAAQK